MIFSAVHVNFFRYISARFLQTSWSEFVVVFINVFNLNFPLFPLLFQRFSPHRSCIFLTIEDPVPDY